ncbi:MAG: F0F1 ATP synthase subunit gamma [Candidatus Babeliales bacterium]|nr:F0F1 ATP synthase subunit gamma [Candidatus Babeliales bacterium]
MVQLIQLRNRIKAIETIKKITHAMRLISMSSHSRLKHKEEPLHNYKNTVSSLFNTLQKLTPEWENSILAPQSEEKNQLIILIGSSKGLCGSFNTTLFHHFKFYAHQHNLILNDAHIVTIGKRAHNYITEHAIGATETSLEELTSKTLTPLAHKLADIIVNAPKPFTSVLVFSNFLKSFFTQKPETTILIPFEINMQLPQASHGNAQDLEEYRWEQKPEEILDILVKQCVDANVQHILFQSLIAEHAARFLSMDNSTRNAQNLLDRTKLDYNKLRQTKITKELSELIGSY